MPILSRQRRSQVIQRGTEPYTTSFNAMREFTSQRTNNTPDQIWVVEHQPVYTLGIGADPRNILAQRGIPVVRADRGGEVTYHGLGQAVVYLLVDLRRLRLSSYMPIREFVRYLEDALIETLGEYSLAGTRKAGAPGIYVANGEWQGAKIASLGLKINANGFTYHGVSLNVNMDLEPFLYINPCGHRGLRVVDMRTLGAKTSLSEAQLVLADKLAGKLSLK